jgi:2-oxoglutarate dehydrogenase E1 component
LERFLQLCGQENMQVVNCTTPANFFHVLRRQLHRNFRKPLIVMTPKSLLRHKRAVSTLADFAPKTSFSKVYGEATPDALKDVKKVVLTSGKLYYDLLEGREAAKLDDTAILRIEQYYPFPYDQLKAELAKYPNAEIVWAQEEPKNMGAWLFIAPYIEEVLEELGRKGERPRYVGRKTSASPAAGYLKIHQREQQALVAEVLGVTM